MAQNTALRAWIEGFGKPVTLACDSEAWDWRWIQKLYATPNQWPINLAQKPDILKFNDEVFNEAVEDAFKQGLRQHHDLDDAKANRLGWLASYVLATLTVLAIYFQD